MMSLAETTAYTAGNGSILDYAWLIPTIPALAMVICGLLGLCKPARKFAAIVTILAVGAAFVVSWLIFMSVGTDPAAFAHAMEEATGAPGQVVHFFEWINVGNFSGNFSFFIDPLTCVMLLVVTGIGTLIAIYASGYMAGDPGYFRFFSYIALFITAMSCLVMADNLLLLYLGWEGVGLASFLLIGYYYRKPSAVAAAKKAFIVNRIGDLGFALGLMGVYLVFGSIEYVDILPAAQAMLAGSGSEGLIGGAAEAFASAETASSTLIVAIPFLLMLGAFGKSAQLPLHVWLPDAMEGPTPVSALIHAATMVTAGVYMISRLIPVFQLSEYALPTVAVVGGVTALFAATIALQQYDIKRVWAYSTVSQLGYMFLGVGVLSTFGGVYHLFTHAFFKALLFLTAGSVMHALAGQLDMRKMSGLIRKMPITAILMLIGCLALAGFPFTAGFASKDTILYEAANSSLWWLGYMGIVTALITAFYTFRLWFRIFLGETEYEMGHEHHGYEMDHAPDDHHEPHEMPWLMNAPLIILAAGALLGGIFGMPDWMEGMIGHSTAAVGSHGAEGGEGYGDHAHAGPIYISHAAMGVITGGGAIVMIGLAAFFFWRNRSLAESIGSRLAPVNKVLYNKYYIDEIYHGLVVMPLRLIGWVCFLLLDRLLIDGVVLKIVQFAPSLAGDAQRPLNRGLLQSLAVSMAAGLAIILVIVVYVVVIV